MLEVWFWQVIVSPHMAHLAVALSRRGCKVSYVAQQAMSEDRAQQGWTAPIFSSVELKFADKIAAVESMVGQASADSIHICQGVRANGSVGWAQRALEKRGLQQWVVMETVNDYGWLGALKRFEYSRIFRARGKRLKGVLATGYRTSDWMVARGILSDQIYPFGYFLQDKNVSINQVQRKPGPLRFMFAGQLITRKRVDWLINALADLSDQSFELWVVGAGPEGRELKALAEIKLESRVHWLGQLSLPDVPTVMAQADCLVLPSVHDGWGAVASEALMAGTPVICSDACGVAGVVRASGAGGVFAVKDRAALRDSLAAQLAKGVVQLDERHRIAEWATCLGADEGARYLLDILKHSKNTANSVRPSPPWKRDLI